MTQTWPTAGALFSIAFHAQTTVAAASGTLAFNADVKVAKNGKVLILQVREPAGVAPATFTEPYLVSLTQFNIPDIPYDFASVCFIKENTTLIACQMFIDDLTKKLVFEKLDGTDFTVTAQVCQLVGDANVIALTS